MLWYHICVTKTKFDYPLHSTFHIWQDFCPDTFWPSWHCLTPKFFDWQLIKNKSFKYNLECYSFQKRLLWIKSSDYISSYELLLIPVTPKTWVWQNFCPGLYVYSKHYNNFQIKYVSESLKKLIVYLAPSSTFWNYCKTIHCITHANILDKYQE